MPNLNIFTDLCPCGSGRLVKDCCLFRHENTIPNLPITGYSNPKYFARELNDCSTNITKEHFLSNSIQEIISTENHYTVQGPHWIPKGQQISIPRSCLASKILCERHNRALSPLDALANNFCRFLFDQEQLTKIMLINGAEIERWMLKLFCGAIASGSLIPGTKNWQPPIEWLKILFQNSSIPKGQGLYFIKGDFFAQFKQVGFSFILEPDDQSNILGIAFIISGLVFVFIPTNTRIKTEGEGISSVYRPGIIQLDYSNLGFVRELHFGNPLGEFIHVGVKPNRQ